MKKVGHTSQDIALMDFEQLTEYLASASKILNQEQTEDALAAVGRPLSDGSVEF